MIKVLKVALDFDWMNMPAYVVEESEPVFRLHINGVPVTCESWPEFRSLVIELQSSEPCMARTIASRVAMKSSGASPDAPTVASSETRSTKD